ncbi:MAG: hypothetical protein ACJ0BJ_00630 [Pirellulales bacterium]
MAQLLGIIRVDLLTARNGLLNRTRSRAAEKTSTRPTTGWQ